MFIITIFKQLLMEEIIYHYTSLEVLKKIIENSSNDEFTMRATHAKYLNDPKEYSLAIDLLRAKLIEYDNTLTFGRSKNMRATLTEKKMSFFQWKEMDDDIPFIISFSKHKDSLPMWNTYGNRSQGIAIGLKKEALNNLGDHVGVKSCLYDTKEYENYLDDNIPSIHRSTRVTIKNESITFTNSSDNNPLDDFYDKYLPLLKHKAFEYEDEERLVIPQKISDFEELQYNLSGNLLKPFKEIQLPLESIKEIILGPNTSAELLQMPLAKLFKKKNMSLTDSFGYNGINLIVSDCPYRNI
jgi:hypothetical protein